MKVEKCPFCGKTARQDYSDEFGYEFTHSCGMCTFTGSSLKSGDEAAEKYNEQVRDIRTVHKTVLMPWQLEDLLKGKTDEVLLHYNVKEGDTLYLTPCEYWWRNGYNYVIGRVVGVRNPKIKKDEALPKYHLDPDTSEEILAGYRMARIVPEYLSLFEARHWRGKEGDEIAEECADERRIDALYYGNGAIKR